MNDVEKKESCKNDLHSPPPLSTLARPLPPCHGHQGALLGAKEDSKEE